MLFASMLPLACTPSEIGLTLAGLILLVLVLGTAEMMWGTRRLRRLREIVPPADLQFPPVSVVVPACNEERQVEAACRAAKAGGGFILRTTGGESGTWGARDLSRVLACAERMIEAWLRHGAYA